MNVDPLNGDTSRNRLKRRLWSQLGPVYDDLSFSGVCFLDLEGSIVAVSDGVCRFLDYHESELIGQQADVLFTPEDRADDKLQKAIASARQSGSVDNRRWAVRKDGGRVLVDGPLLALHDDDGQLTGFAEVMRDVTERAQAGDTVRKSEQRYRMLFDAVEEGFCIIDVLFNQSGSASTFRYVETNPAFHALTGIARQEMRARHPSEIDQEFWFTAAKKVLELGDTIRFEVQTRDTDRWFDVRAWLLRDDTATQVAVIFTNITARKASETELQATAQRYRVLFDFMLVGVYTCDAEGLVQDFNQRAVELWGREPNSGGMIDRYNAALHLYYHDGRPMPHEQSPMARALRGEELDPDDLELKIERPDGSFKHVGVRPNVLTDPNGNIVGAINNLYDFTEHALSEDALRERNAALELRLLRCGNELKMSEARFQQAFDAAPVAACITSFVDDQIIEVNQTFVALTGYAPADVVGRTTRELGMWSRKEDQITLAAALEGESGENYRGVTLQLRTKSGTVRDIFASGQKIKLNAQPAWLRMFLDITDRQRTEEELIKAIEEVMSDPSWFSTSVVQRLAELRRPDASVKDSLDLTRRERQVIEQMARGRSDVEIAAGMGISRLTVRNYVGNIYNKLNVHNRAEAVVWARERGLLG